MNKKGFTLIELLAVIIILALLALLTFPAITKLVKDSKEELSGAQLSLIKSAAETFIADNMDSLPEVNKCSYITATDLKSFGLIDESVTKNLSDIDSLDNIYIKMTTTSGTYGTPITNYEINPENLDGCRYAYAGECFEYQLVEGGIEITDYLDSYVEDSVEYTCPRDVKIPKIIDGKLVVSIGDRSMQIINLTSVEIPDTVTNIADQAFYKNKLTYINIPSSVNFIGVGAFAYNQLTNLVIPDGVKTIDVASFCHNEITNLIISDTVETIKESAFEENNISNVIIPKNVKVLENFIFDVNPIKSVIIKGKTSINDFEVFGTENDKVFNGWFDESNIIFQPY